MTHTKAIVVRLYEAFGGQNSATLTSQLPFKASQRLLCHRLLGAVGYEPVHVFVGATCWRTAQDHWRLGLVNCALISNLSKLLMFLFTFEQFYNRKLYQNEY